MGKFMKRQPNGNRQRREPPKDNFDSSRKYFVILINKSGVQNPV
jgi:hypothetical protein